MWGKIAVLTSKLLRHDDPCGAGRDGPELGPPGSAAVGCWVSPFPSSPHLHAHLQLGSWSKVGEAKEAEKLPPKPGS